MGRAVLLGAAAALAAAAPAPAQQVREEPVPSRATDAPEVLVSLVRVHDPLPEAAGAHPETCDWLESLRFRHREGPARAERAAAVVVLIPGFLGGAGSFDQVARLTVQKAAAAGRHVEVWTLDRRSNCLEDQHGLAAADAARDGTVAYDYYWGEEEVAGRRFRGFVSPREASFLREVGLERTVRDWHRVMRVAVPDRRTREARTVCGGHSLGGSLTAAFSSWDFGDGDPQTTEDAGYRQCAGLVALDSTVDLATSDGFQGPAGADAPGGLAAGAAPYVNAPPLTPETIQVASVFGVGAFHDPTGTEMLRRLPVTPNLETARRMLFSRDAAHFAIDRPNIRDFALTNEVVLGGVFDNNSASLSFLRSSVGFPTGGPVVEKDFPAPDSTLALPADEDVGPYAWLDYDEIGDDIPLNRENRPFTTREAEVSGIDDLARALFEAPADFIEQYFPVRILTDVAAARAGDRSGSLSGLQHDGPAMKPILELTAGDSDANGTAEEVDREPFEGPAPNDLPDSRQVTLPGYAHLDVLTAARRQNDGRPEPASSEVARFALTVTGALEGRRVRPRLRVRVRRQRGGRYVTRMRLRAPQPVSRAAACRGRLSVQVKAGGRTISTRRARVDRRCLAFSQVRFTNPRRSAGRSRLRFIVRYHGSEALRRARTRRVVRAAAG